ncbi:MULTISPECIES: alpha/beta hydrolase [Mesorhizobium]|uniref:alpha/beta hydrolase n=1 Tax=Mesorhizobium TaxID=68287 RepID=UPI0007A952E7|nr:MULTISPECIES: alpha/beta hydrolase [Mesorhizobium]RUZ92592.1 alpha/beta hydrolase [Mesorhizobium sp. M7A.F.Ca.US.003.02.2.1]AMX95023.1 carboxylesterase [Mesorhizobium ciceri]MBZ9718655.1 alpha/beta hydrolase [Mesorhizobium sp. AD1-1]MDF3209668.1 alpha/beta hydrolase [Mesorhizobium sp. LMG15046]MDF3232027.1 alpha/beta hydrolase [Mesorhizobium sp. DSM 30133]
MIDRRSLIMASMAAMLPLEASAAWKTRRPTPETFDYGPAKLDIYAPDGATGLPVVFFVHGGTWQFGKRSQVDAKPAFLLANGFCFVSIDYRMLPQANVATQAGDVEKAYAYIRANIARHGGDPNRIVGMGHSAGCHLVALTGMRGGLPGIAALILDDTRAYDLAALAKNGGMVRAYARVFSDPAQWAALSPASYVDGRKHPPTFIAYSRASGRSEDSRAFAERLRSTGTKVTLFDGSAYTHMSINRDFGEEGDALTAAALAFLKSTVG